MTLQRHDLPQIQPDLCVISAGRFTRSLKPACHTTNRPLDEDAHSTPAALATSAAKAHDSTPSMAWGPSFLAPIQTTHAMSTVEAHPGMPSEATAKPCELAKVETLTGLSAQQLFLKSALAAANEVGACLSYSGALEIIVLNSMDMYRAFLPVLLIRALVSSI